MLRLMGLRVRAHKVAGGPNLWPTGAPCSDADYTDAFEAPAVGSEEQPAEAWMRSTLEGAPAWLRGFVSLGWRLVLGFRPSRSMSILGWPVVEATDEWIVLEQQSRLVAAVLLLRTGPTGITWATRVRYKSRAGSILWTVVGLVHRRVVPYLIEHVATPRA